MTTKVGSIITNHTSSIGAQLFCRHSNRIFRCYCGKFSLSYKTAGTSPDNFKESYTIITHYAYQMGYTDTKKSNLSDCDKYCGKMGVFMYRQIRKRKAPKALIIQCFRGSCSSYSVE